MSTTKTKPGRPRNDIWEYYTQGERDSEGHASAECNFCHVKYSRGEIEIMKGHLANHCPDAPGNVIRTYQNLFEQKAKNINNTGNKKRKGQMTLNDYHDKDEPLPQGRINRINRALIKLFVCCGMSFRIVESPFFIDFLKELNSGYSPPSRDLLSGRLLEDELGNVNSKISNELKLTDNLTLGRYLSNIIFISYY
jgi:BED zinc finger